jgi:methyl-accepting chemotaxis protein
MGFAVVADEVRTLAQRSAQAAKETAVKIDDSIQKSSVGVQISSRVAESLKLIATKTRQVDDLVGEIATASAEQTRGIEQVNGAVSQMDKVTQGNAASAEETAAASEQLKAQALTLLDAVQELNALAGGTAPSAHAVTAPRAPQSSAPRAKKHPAAQHHHSAPARQPVRTASPVKHDTHRAPAPASNEIISPQLGSASRSTLPATSEGGARADDLNFENF